MKERIKKILYEIVYQLYKKRIFQNNLHVRTLDETIDILIDSDYSIVRYGDAEIRMMEGYSVEFQEYDDVLSCRLREIIRHEQKKLLVGIPDIFENLEEYTERSADFWKEHLFFSRKTYEKYCDINKKYCNAFLSRLYYIYKNKENCQEWFEKIKLIWKGKKILLVEGEVAHNGVGNDLFDNVYSISRIICPSRNAFASYEKIFDACLKYPKDVLVLVAVGTTAKVLACDLVNCGYRVIDIGNLDMEYEWFLKRTSRKEPVEKHKIIGLEANKNAGYHEYLDQVRIKIE